MLAKPSIQQKLAHFASIKYTLINACYVTLPENATKDYPFPYFFHYISSLVIIKGQFLYLCNSW